MALQFNPADPATNADPFPIFRRLQDEDPVHWSGAVKGWNITRYDDVRAIALDRSMSADRVRPFFDVLPGEEQRRLADLGRYLTLWAVFKDPPDHTRLRGLMNRAFTPRAVEALRPNIERIVDDLIDAIVARGAADLIADFAYPLPASVIMDMLGVPRSDLAVMKVWSDDIALFVGIARATPDKYAKAQTGTREMAAYFRRLVAERRKAPREDMISALIAAEEHAQHLTEDEIVASCILLLFAGHETTANLIGNGVLAFLRHPGELAKLRARPELAGSAVEECLRYDGPSGALARVVAVAHEMGGRRLKPGERVYAWMNAANRDPRRFAEPDRFDIERPDNRHLTFGHGAHFCLGAPLARLEAQIAFPRLFERLQGLELTTDKFESMDSLILRGVKKLPVRFAPVSARRMAV
ncbi:MAG: cytochrome P450 [Hyphomicrobiales bacterium]|nr:cytochrome P450 [Hyphomicrobiales bacterium]MBV8825948.1 cytochrome P450 [Hyphomicrobiales bacterium]MBV9426933.1 cytochrome P450 [Bradyrhizobiaceae bacterium]